MEFKFKSSVLLTIENTDGKGPSKHVSTDFNLEVISDNLDKSVYLNDETFLTKAGSEVVSNVLIQGLIGNLHLSHQKGFRDSAEHLRWIISELEKGFVSLVDIETTNTDI